MNERSEILAWLRGELVGPSQSTSSPTKITIHDRKFVDPEPLRQGPLVWEPVPGMEPEEVLYFEREVPHRKYGAGLLHPMADMVAPAEVALQEKDSLGTESGEEAEPAIDDVVSEDGEEDRQEESDARDEADAVPDDFEVTSPDIRHPSTLGISFRVRLGESGSILLKIPNSRRFFWQKSDAKPFALNGRYELCHREWSREGKVRDAPMWRRVAAVLPGAQVVIRRTELVSGQVLRKDVVMPEGSPLALRFELFPRQLGEADWLLTAVLRNSSRPGSAKVRESILYQTLFEVEVSGGQFERYPESQRPFEQLDDEEQSLALLYRESATWATGHGCAAAWDAEPNVRPETLYSDVMPAVQLPSMTPDIEIDGVPIKISMRSMATLPDEASGPAWAMLGELVSGYSKWIERQREDATTLPSNLKTVANRHLDICKGCLRRIERGIEIVRNDARARRAFRLANLAMLLQQISAKQIGRRPLRWDDARSAVVPEGDFISPWRIFQNEAEDTSRVGSWRAFQIAFLLMSLDGVHEGQSADRAIVDLIWFPTGGGKTEAYLAVMAFYMFHERFLMADRGGLPRDNTNVLMRYTLRMLTTQQFQRAASLICAMEYLRRNADSCGTGEIPGRRFSLGLWIGGGGSPNTVAEAKSQIGQFRRGDADGNPLVVTECPWCRAEIGRYQGSLPRQMARRQNELRLRGISQNSDGDPLLHCPDGRCEFGQENSERWLPVEVIDERIYAAPPSLVIATADKLAIVAYRPLAGALFGRRFLSDRVIQEAVPPGLIVQDELHLISGPLGTMYALYESIIEHLCSHGSEGTVIKPKIIASTATIRGANEQVKSVYARDKVQLFPSPGLLMGDSFFGRYARDENGKLRDGRLYLGVHANDYGSVLTTQVRAFSAALFRPWTFEDERRDAWWTLLAFYNSIRELGGARTLFDSDIRSRLKFMFNREGFGLNARRNLRIIEELTSRLSQAEIVKMMDRLSVSYTRARASDIIDACLASNIIEVGVDIDRLSLMGVVGQPKTTATYIQVTGRVGRRWWDRPGLVMTIYNPSKSRDRSHFEQFHSYHRRLYERVEPASATPFAVSAVQRGAAGALIAWARQNSTAPVDSYQSYADSLDFAHGLLLQRSDAVQEAPDDRARSRKELERILNELREKWRLNPQRWESFPQRVDGEYLMLWPGQYATALQQRHGVQVPSSLRQVDRSAELSITQGYAAEVTAPAAAATPSGTGGNT